MKIYLNYHNYFINFYEKIVEEILYYEYEKKLDVKRIRNLRRDYYILELYFYFYFLVASSSSYYYYYYH